MLRARTPRHVRQLCAADEDGYTLIELLVSLSISMVVIGISVAVIVVFLSAQVSTANSINAASQVRLAQLQLQSDIQSANPLGTQASVAAYGDNLSLTTQPSGKTVTWAYSPTTKKLTRKVGTGTAVVVVSNMTNGDPTAGGIPVFAYFDHCGTNLASQSGATPSSISSGTTVVQVTISVANVNSAPYGSTTAVSILNNPPGAVAC